MLIFSIDKLELWNTCYLHKNPGSAAVDCGHERVRSKETNSSHYLLTQSNRKLALHDKRFLQTPVKQLQGHVNSYSYNLALATWQDVIVAAGQDNAIRIWSTSNGSNAPLVLSDNPASLCKRRFANPITALVLEHYKPNLWVGDGHELCRFAIDH